MRKRSMIAAVATALALVVLTAGLAFAGGRWDDRRGPGQTVDDRVTSGWTQPQAQQGSGSVEPAGQRTGADCLGVSSAPGRADRHDINCPDQTEHRADGPHSTRSGPAADAGSSTSGQPWQDSRNHREDRHDRHEFRDGRCQDDRR